MFLPEAKGGRFVPAFAFTMVTNLSPGQLLTPSAWLEEKLSEEKAVAARLRKFPVGWF